MDILYISFGIILCKVVSVRFTAKYRSQGAPISKFNVKLCSSGAMEQLRDGGAPLLIWFAHFVVYYWKVVCLNHYGHTP